MNAGRIDQIGIDSGGCEVRGCIGNFGEKNFARGLSVAGIAPGHIPGRILRCMRNCAKESLSRHRDIIECPMNRA